MHVFYCLVLQLAQPSFLNRQSSPTKNQRTRSRTSGQSTCARQLPQGLTPFPSTGDALKENSRYGRYILSANRCTPEVKHSAFQVKRQPVFSSHGGVQLLFTPPLGRLKAGGLMFRAGYRGEGFRLLLWSLAGFTGEGLRLLGADGRPFTGAASRARRLSLARRKRQS